MRRRHLTAVAAGLVLGAAVLAASAQAVPRLELVNVEASKSFAGRNFEVTVIARCPRGSFPIAAANAGSIVAPKALVPVKVGGRRGFQGVWDQLAFDGVGGRQAINAICARGAGGLRVAFNDAGLRTPIAVNSARGPTVNVRVVHAETEEISITHPNLLRASCPAGASIVGYGWRWGKVRNITRLQSVRLEQAGSRQAVVFRVFLQGQSGEEYEPQSFDIYAVCLAGAGVKVSLAEREFEAKRVPRGNVFRGRISCRGRTRALGFPFFSVTNGAYSQDSFTTIARMRPVRGAKATSFDFAPIRRTDDIETNFPEVDLQQPCVRAAGWTVDGSGL